MMPSRTTSRMTAPATMPTIRPTRLLRFGGTAGGVGCGGQGWYGGLVGGVVMLGPFMVGVDVLSTSRPKCEAEG
jgi:hypothetical protein